MCLDLLELFINNFVTFNQISNSHLPAFLGFSILLQSHIVNPHRIKGLTLKTYESQFLVMDNLLILFFSL